MGWLFGRHRKSLAEKTLEVLQQQAADRGYGSPAPDVVAPSPAEPGTGQPPVAEFDTEQTSPTPTAARSEGTDVAMRIDSKFTITGRGLVLPGTIANGSVRTGQQVRVISRQHGATQPLRVLGIESFRKMRDSAQAGDEIGLLLRGLSRDDVDPGDQIVG